MSHPFKGVPKLPLGGSMAPARDTASSQPDVHTALANLEQPRKHYKWYYSTSPASAEMSPADGMERFFHGYFYLKSGLWPGNSPHPLKEWSAEELAKMPYYYVMPLNVGMRKAVEMALEEGPPPPPPGRDSTSSHDKQNLPELPFLSRSDLATYATEYARTGFQGGLNYYRVGTEPKYQADLLLFAGKKIEVPTLVVLGEKDWGSYQEPGVLEKMEKEVVQDGCWRGAKMLEGVGHWIPIEGAEEVVEAIKGISAE